MSWKRWAVSIAALAIASAIASAQTTTEIKRGTVMTTWADQLVVRMDDGTTRQITVPAGFQFDHEGKKVGLADLKPGWELTATIKTTTAPKVVQTTEVKNGTVIMVKAGTLTYMDDAGKNQQWTPPEGFKFLVDGHPTDLKDLKPKTRLSAVIVRTTTTDETTKSTSVAAKSGEKAAAPAPAPAAAPAAAPAPAPTAAPSTSAAPKAEEKAEAPTPAPAAAPAAAAAPEPAPAPAPAPASNLMYWIIAAIILALIIIIVGVKLSRRDQKK